MKNIIYYFTGTGNSLAVAKDIKARLGEAELAEIKKGVVPDQELQAETVGIVYPVYCWGPPRLVADFLKGLKVSRSTYVYCVATYGGMLGYSNVFVEKVLKEKGIVLSAGFAVKMPGNFIPMYNGPSEKKVQKMFSKKDALVKKIAEIVCNRKVAEVAKSMSFVGKFLTNKVYPNGIQDMKKFGEKFSADSSCNGCGTCAKICPSSNIVMKDNKPQWLKDCEACLACIHWCPQKAIQAGKKTLVRRRYHHPAVALSEMLKR